MVVSISRSRVTLRLLGEVSSMPVSVGERSCCRFWVLASDSSSAVTSRGFSVVSPGLARDLGTMGLYLWSANPLHCWRRRGVLHQPLHQRLRALFHHQRGLQDLRDEALGEPAADLLLE